MQQMLYREAFKVLGDRFEAEDAVQNLYVRLWEQRDEIGHIVSPEAYCRTMLKRICIDRWRRIRARDADVKFVEETSEANAPPEAEGEAAAEYLEHFLTTLPEMQRRVMRMQMQGRVVRKCSRNSAAASPSASGGALASDVSSTNSTSASRALILRQRSMQIRLSIVRQ